MNITPLEIRQKAFETHFRGYDKDEVDAFLLSLSQEWERLNGTVRELEIRLESSDKELSKLREVESSLYKTLKTAEDTSQSVISQANKSAELQLRETQMNTDALLNDARVLAKDMIDEAETSIKNSFDLMKEQFHALQGDYTSLQSHRENLLMEMKNFTSSIQEKVTRSENQKFTFKLDLETKDAFNVNNALEPLDRAYEQLVKSKNFTDSINSKKTENKPPVEIISSEKEILDRIESPIVNRVEPKTDEDEDEGSFFDM